MNDSDVKLLRMLFFRKDGSLNLLGKIALILGILLAGAVASMFSGCVNLYTRCPTTDEKITMVYQCSREAAGLSVLVAFPQAMSDGPSRGFMWENIFTIPLGCLCMCDAAVEACIDTVCLPVDWPLAASRKEGR